MFSLRSYLFRSWWLSNISLADAGRPALWPEAAATSGTTVFIVDSWTPPPAGSSNRTIHVYSNAPLVRLWVNGKEVGTRVLVSFFGAATFDDVAFEPGNLTAEALDSSGATRLAAHSAHSSGPAVQIRLSLEAPSPETGTGAALVADGQDVALVRAELVDSGGRLVSPLQNSTNATVSFSLASGDGRILGVISGSPWTQPLAEPQLDQTSSSYPAHYGMVAAFVQSTRVCAGTQVERARLKAVHVDAGRDGSSQIDDDDSICGKPPEDIVVLARAEGMATATLRIPMTNDVASLPLAVAAQLATQSAAVVGTS